LLPNWLGLACGHPMVLLVIGWLCSLLAWLCCDIPPLVPSFPLPFGFFLLLSAFPLSAHSIQLFYLTLVFNLSS